MIRAALAFAPLLISGCATTNPGNSSSKGELPATPIPPVASLQGALQENGNTTLTLALADVIERTARDNPMVRAARLRWEAALNRHPQAVSLPDPKVEGTVFSPKDDEKWMAGITQEIPWPGKLIIAGQIADKEAQGEFLKYEKALRDAIAEAKIAWCELWYLDRAEEVTRQVEAIYARYAALAAGGVKLGETNLPETFRAEAQRAQLGYDVVRLREIREVEDARLQELTAMPAKTSFQTSPDAIAAPNPLPSLETLRATADKYSQELRAAGIERDRMREELRLARRAAIPDFMIGLRYTEMVVPGVIEPGMSGPNNPVGFTLGFNVPIWPRKYAARAAEARKNSEAAAAEVEAAGLKLQSELARSYYDAVNSDRLVQLYELTLIPQSRQALQSAEELFRTGAASMAAVLETTATVHNFELARLRAVADRIQNRARLEQVTGRALDAATSEGGAGR